MVAATASSSSPSATIRGAPKRAISEPGKKARPVHRHDVPLNAEIGIADAEPAHLHRQRRRGHHQIHHRIGDDAAQRRGDEARLPHDLEQRTAAVQIRRRRLRRIDTRQHRHRHQRDHRLHHEAEGEQIRRPDIHGPLHELRAEHAGEHAAGHHPRHRLGPIFGAGAVGGGEAIGLRHRAIQSAEERRAAEQRERSVQDGERAEQAGQHAAAGADDEGDAAAVARARSRRSAACRRQARPHTSRAARSRTRRPGASVAPTIEPVAKITAELAPVSACAAASRTTLDRARASSVISSAAVKRSSAGSGRGGCSRPPDFRHYGAPPRGDQPMQTGVRHASGVQTGWLRPNTRIRLLAGISTISTSASPAAPPAFQARRYRARPIPDCCREGCCRTRHC